MLVTRTPISIPLCGGYTDEASFFKNNDFGAVCSLAINKYVYVAANHAPCELDAEVENYDQVAMHECPKIEGSGCAFAVGQANARALVLDMAILSKEELAKTAASLGKGLRGHYYGAAFGGLTYFEFRADGSVGIDPLIIDPAREENFLKHLLLLHTGPRKPVPPLPVDILCWSRVRAQACAKAWTMGKPKDFGDILRTELFDSPHPLSRATVGLLGAGAWGCKELGEYTLVCAKPESHSKILALGDKAVPFAIDWKGSVSFYVGE